MKIVHLCLACFYIDNYSYQENMLPKFHKKMGLDVYIVASTLSFDENGDSCNISAGSYINEYGIPVTRLAYKTKICKKIGKFFRIYDGLSQKLEEILPDIIFIHGCQFCDISIVAKYAKKHNVAIYVDNHADFSNSATNWFSKNFLHKCLWKKCAKKIEPFTIRFYGVLPIRVDFLTDIYKIPKEKCELLVMGADDDLVSAANKPDSIFRIRKKFNIKNDDFVIVTGGKIDKWKTQTLFLMDAVKNLSNKKIKLIVFGSVSTDLKDAFISKVDNTRIFYAGWIESKYSYNYFAAADLVVFPGRHSVMWEQVVAQGIPMICKEWNGTKHVDLGGNVIFLKNDGVEELQKVICNVASNMKLYEKMKECAIEKGITTFSYREIAKQAIRDCLRGEE